MAKKEKRIIPLPGRPNEGIDEDGERYINLEEDKKLYKRLTDKKSKSLGGRPKGFTKRTINRYKKVYHQFVTLKTKYPNWKKSELYELVSTQDYDGTTYSRKTIRNIIEEKRYNLKPSR